MEERHCIRCGEAIPEGSEYCPTCGASLDGTAYDRTADFYRNKAGWKKEDTLQSIPKLMMVYGVLAVIVGAVVLALGPLDEAEAGEVIGPVRHRGAQGALVLGDVRCLHRDAGKVEAAEDGKLLEGETLFRNGVLPDDVIRPANGHVFPEVHACTPPMVCFATRRTTESRHLTRWYTFFPQKRPGHTRRNKSLPWASVATCSAGR